MSSAQKPRLLYKVHKIRKTNDKKTEQLQKDFPKLLKRLKLEGPTKWMKNALKFAIEKLRRAGFSDKVIEKKFNISVAETLKKDKAPKKTKAVKKVAKTVVKKAAATKAKVEKAPKKAIVKKPVKKVTAKKPAAPKKEKAPAKPKKKPAAKKK